MEELVKKTILITKKQEEWLKENCINLSLFIRKCLDEAMSKK